MSPYQHGEVYVTDDGAETDLDQVTTNVSSTSTLTNIQTLQLVKFTEVLRKERKGEYLGNCPSYPTHH